MRVIHWTNIAWLGPIPFITERHLPMAQFAAAFMRATFDG